MLVIRWKKCIFAAKKYNYNYEEDFITVSFVKLLFCDIRK